MLLTFTRRAAAEMLRRVDGVLRGLTNSTERKSHAAASSKRLWGGTFHSVATRLLRAHGKQIGLEPGFTIHDRGDSEGGSRLAQRSPVLGRAPCIAAVALFLSTPDTFAGIVGRRPKLCRDEAMGLVRRSKALDLIV